jgi:hypothetical protein
MKPYDHLHLIPAIVAERVCAREYKGEEYSPAVRDTQSVIEIEALRRKMTPEDVQAFAEYADKKCEETYTAKAGWFMKIVRTKTNAGRAQLYVWISHWMTAWLKHNTH